MSGGASGHVGGVERQTTMLATWLSRHGYDVTLLTWDEGQPDELILDGVRVIKMCRRDDGLPGLRFFHPRWTSLVKALRRSDADIYYQNCAEYVTGQVAWWCRMSKRRFVYSVASDPDCDPRLPAMRTLRERVLYRYGLRHADRVIVQTQNQQRMLRDGFGVASSVLPMPCPGPEGAEYLPPTAPTPDTARVLWVGRIVPLKRPEWLIALADSLPQITFELVGGPDTDRLFSESIFDQARRRRNIVVHGAVSRDRIADLYRQASLMCCTSVYEGFPNTFLEAWSHGVPVISTIDPDGIIAAREVGGIAHTVEEFVSHIQRLAGDPASWRRNSENARQYYLQNHSLNVAMSRFRNVFDELKPVDQ
jgi:glycosyltransferase involved in cell wall biosynthesis